MASSHLCSSLYREITLSTSPCKDVMGGGGGAKREGAGMGVAKAPYPLQKNLLGLLKVFVEDSQLCLDCVMSATILSLTLWGREGEEGRNTT